MNWNLKGKLLSISVLVLLILGCRNYGGSGADVGNTSVRQTKPYITADDTTQMHFTIYEDLCKINSKLLPSVVRLFCNNNNEIEGRIIDDSYILITSQGHDKKTVGTDLFVKELQGRDGKKYFFINAIRYDSLRYLNYFYVLKRLRKGKFENVTLNVIPDDVVQVISIELGGLHYNKAGNIWAFYTDSSHSALFFDFHGDYANVYKCLLGGSETVQDSCTPFLKIFWEDNHFTYNIVTEESRYGMLSQNQLDYVRRFTSLSEAIDNAKSAYILNVSGQGLTALPEEIGLLTKLQILVLSDNQLDSLPHSIGNLKKLQIFRADNNRLKTLPKEFGNLTFLEEVDLSHNRLEWIPYEFKNLTNLLKLDLSYNNLQLLAYDMTNMDKLAVLNISNNNFEKFPNQIFNLKCLVYLDVSNNPIKILPRSFEKLPNLKYLDIRNTLIDTTQINYFKLKIPNIELIY